MKSWVTSSSTSWPPRGLMMLLFICCTSSIYQMIFNFKASQQLFVKDKTIKNDDDDDTATTTTPNNNIPSDISTNATAIAVAAANTNSSSSSSSMGSDDDGGGVDGSFDISNVVDDDDVGRHNISIVVKLTGELGNQLGKVAYAYTIQLELKRKYNIESHLILRHHSAPKWIHTRNDLKNCFPFFRSFNFSAGNIDEFGHYTKRQRKILSKPLEFKREDEHRVPEYLEFLNKTLRQSEKDNVYNFTTNMDRNDGSTTNHPFTFPMIATGIRLSIEAQMDEYYNEMRNLFQFDYSNPTCCKQRPYPDESIFHFRNFYTENFHGGAEKGDSELDPDNTANKLFGHLKPGSKLAIATRYIPYRENTRIMQYVDALKQRGINVRLTSNDNITHTGVQDFCFLLNGRSELGGSGKSTYYKWAVWLRKYTQEGTAWFAYLDNHYTPRKGENKPTLNWTYHPELNSTIRVTVIEDEGVNITEWESLFGKKDLRFRIEGDYENSTAS